MKAFNIIFFLCLFLLSCEKDDKDYIYDVNIENLQAEAFPGAINLSWKVPEDSSFLYMKVSYYDYGTEEEKVKVCSEYTNSLYIDGLLNKYGKYKFSFTPYDIRNVPGKTFYLEKECEKKAPWYVAIGEELIPLSADQLSTAAQEVSEGPIENLVDDDPETFFQSMWTHPEWIPAGPHYIIFDLRKEVSAFTFKYWNRLQKGGSLPKTVNLYGSNDGKKWDLIEVLTDLPSELGSVYTSGTYIPESPVSYIKYEVVATTGKSVFFSLAEVKFYEVIRELVDPEL